MGNTNAKEFFQKYDNLNKISTHIEHLGAEDINHDELQKAFYQKFNLKKIDNKIFDWDNVREFAKNESLKDQIQLHSVKQKLLIGMIPEEKCPDLTNPAFFDNIQEVYNSKQVNEFSMRQKEKFLYLYNLFYQKQNQLKHASTSIDDMKHFMELPSNKLPKAVVIGIRSGV